VRVRRPSTACWMGYKPSFTNFLGIFAAFYCQRVAAVGERVLLATPSLPATLSHSGQLINFLKSFPPGSH
jgi:hypothetical protein